MSEETYPGEANEAAADEASCTPLSDPQVMTREQVEGRIQWYGENFVLYRTRWATELLAHDAAQRETIRRLGARLARYDRWTPEHNIEQWLADVQARLTASEAKVNELEADMITLQRLLTSSRSTHKWTKEQPTVAGFYWWREDRGMKGWLVDVLADLTVKAITGDGDQIDFLHVIEIGGEWQGPITPGEE